MAIYKDERRELEDWRKIVLDEILRRQLDEQLADKRADKRRAVCHS